MPGQTRLTTSHHMHVHVITMDDGKVNAMSPDMLRASRSSCSQAPRVSSLRASICPSLLPALKVHLKCCSSVPE